MGVFDGPMVPIHMKFALQPKSKSQAREVERLAEVDRRVHRDAGVRVLRRMSGVLLPDVAAHPLDALRGEPAALHPLPRLHVALGLVGRQLPVVGLHRDRVTQ